VDELARAAILRTNDMLGPTKYERLEPEGNGRFDGYSVSLAPALQRTDICAFSLGLFAVGSRSQLYDLSLYAFSGVTQNFGSIEDDLVYFPS
jgi:hypothetical protein